MKFKDSDDEDLQINLTPLIDVVFLLLIFFMVSTTFSKESQLRIKLPEASAEAVQNAQDNILLIEIGESGAYAIKGPGEKRAKQLLNTNFDTLRRAMQVAMKDRSDLITVIRADRRTPHEAVISAMDASRRLGLVHITFSTQQKADKGSK